MFSDNLLQGLPLPEKTLCLTFDDGPGFSSRNNSGPKTLEIAQFLYEEGIVGTFFMVGKFIKKYPEIVFKVKNLGHVVGSHTYSHPDLPKKLFFGGDILSELTKTENLLKCFLDNNTVYFRPPFGKWNKDVSDNLNRNFISNFKYVGPIGWEINGYDWFYWSNNNEDRANNCAREYLKIIKEKKNGIVLFHDSSADKNFIWASIRRWNNKTLSTLKIIIPQLKDDGFSFVGINKINFEANV